MMLKNMKIGTQLAVSLGSILLLVTFLGGMAWYQADSLWRESEGLYKHPYQVRKAMGEIKSDFLGIHLEMKNLVLTESDRDRQQVLKEIDSYDADATRQFEILYDSYLGPRSDIDTAHNAFVQWKSIRAETIRLLQSGNKAEALNRTRSTGIGGEHVKALIVHINKISDFALARADKFYANAKLHKESVMVRLGGVLSAILLLTLAVSYFLQKGIKDPLQELTSVAEQFRSGNLAARSSYVSGNEFGVLSDSFNALAETVQLELKSKEDSASLSNSLLQQDELHSFCQELLKALIQHSGSQIGAVYLLNGQKTEFEHFESIGLSSIGRSTFSAAAQDGEFGAALVSRQIQHIKNIPTDTRFTFAAVSGDFTPRDIITIPIISGPEVVAVVSLAALQSYSEPALRLINGSWNVLTARLNSVLVLQQIREFSERLEQQNQELDAQKRELTTQKDELSEQNVELELQKNQLDKANRLKNTFLSNMSHELRTPLNSVIALSGVLNRRLANTIPEEEYSYLEIIERNGKNLLALINDILDLARIEAGREEVSPSRFSVRELAAEVVAMIEPQSLQKGIALLNQVDRNLPLIRSDITKCRHILQNLVANAVKFTGDGSVEINAVVKNDAIRISVTDTGIGIAEDQIQYIFDEFRQADESTTKNYGGSGLGLSIARKYAILLQGSITVVSAPGKGSTFSINLPLSIDLPSAEDWTEQGPGYQLHLKTADLPLDSTGPGKRILVVEDNEPAVIQLTDILTEQGYSVQVAKNGREALEWIGIAPPDAMILDLMMPEVDGFEVLRTIRSQEKNSLIPVLILTAKHVTREELSFLTGNHIHQLIQKGDINRTDLLAAVGRMVTPECKQKVRPLQPLVMTPLSGKPTVLIVEDNPDNAKTLKALLLESCTVIEAADGQAGLETARITRPDLILMDISMPVMDGFKALDGIRNDLALCDIPVIAVTASAMSGNREEILAHGFDGYLSKPVDWKLLDEMIREKLDES